MILNRVVRQVFYSTGRFGKISSFFRLIKDGERWDGAVFCMQVEPGLAGWFDAGQARLSVLRMSSPKSLHSTLLNLK
jgi:hypothetical protein